MITNLLASVIISFVTNVNERVPMSWANLPNPNIKGDGWQLAVAYGTYVPDPDPKQKWIRTTVKKIKKLEFKFEDRPYSLPLKEETVSDTEVEYALKRMDSWVPAGTNTFGPFSFTNQIIQWTR